MDQTPEINNQAFGTNASTRILFRLKDDMREASKLFPYSRQKVRIFILTSRRDFLQKDRNYETGNSTVKKFDKLLIPRWRESGGTFHCARARLLCACAKNARANRRRPRQRQHSRG